MSIITQTRTWNRIQVKIETNNETAEVKVYAIGSGFLGIDELLASSQGKGNDWVVNNPQAFSNVFNRRNNTNRTKEEVQKAFLTEGYKVFDNDRAAVLNNSDNYSSPQVAAINQKNFYSNRVPRVLNPVTKQQVNSQAQQSSQQTTSTTQQPQPQTVGDQTITSGASVDAGGSTSSGGSADVPPTPTEESTVLDKQPVKTISPTTDPNQIPPKNAPILRYPLANLDVVGQELGIGYDYIKIQIVNHISSLDPNVFLPGQNSQITNAEQQLEAQLKQITSNKDISNKYKENSDRFATIILPMQSNLSTSNSVDWGSDSLNIAQLVGGQLFTNYFTSTGSGNAIESMKNLAVQAIQSMGTFADIGVANKNTIAALMAGYLVGNNNIATRATGTVINPNMEMLFNGPRMRTFNFQFDMTPRFKEESDQIKKIIKTFKKYMSPSKTPGNAFLRSPKIFLLEYIYNGNIKSGVANGNTHPYLNKFKPCALTEFNVNYTPDGSYMTYRDDGSMTKYSISMSFSEIAPIYQSDYDDDTNDMGY